MRKAWLLDNKNFADKHWISDTKKYIHQISREMAVWMFENEADKASIPQKEYQKICNNIIQEIERKKEIGQDFLIGNFFTLVKHCEGVKTEELYFVHRSIYEYFVAETIFVSVCNMINVSKEELAGVLAKLLKKNRLS